MKMFVKDAALTALVLAFALPVVASPVATLETLSLGTPGDGSSAYAGPGGGHYWNGSDESGEFEESGTRFLNDYNSTWSSWGGFAYSNTSDNTTPGWGNQYSAHPGSGAGGSSTYAVGYVGGFPPMIMFNSSQDLSGRGVFVANTTYAALDMQNGTVGVSKKFGGASGDDPDWFKLSIHGYLAENPTGSVEFYLADFRFADNSQDYILDTWAFVDLSALGTVDFVEFELSSTDNGIYGMNTPGYFALDNIGAVPEPATLGLLLSGLLLIWKLRNHARAKNR